MPIIHCVQWKIQVLGESLFKVTHFCLCRAPLPIWAHSSDPGQQGEKEKAAAKDGSCRKPEVSTMETQRLDCSSGKVSTHALWKSSQRAMPNLEGWEGSGAQRSPGLALQCTHCGPWAIPPSPWVSVSFSVKRGAWTRTWCLSDVSAILTGERTWVFRRITASSHDFGPCCFFF